MGVAWAPQKIKQSHLKPTGTWGLTVLLAWVAAGVGLLIALLGVLADQGAEETPLTPYDA